MIYADMKGNIGNQMFIYACARKLQEETGQKITLNTYYLKKNYQDYKFDLDIFELNPNIIIDDKRIPFFTSTESILYRLIKHIHFANNFLGKLYFRIFSKFNIFVWNDTTYMPIKLKNKKRNIYISGFWQCPEYLENIREILLKEFSLKKTLRKENMELKKIIDETNSVCVSIRRGDYLSNPVFKKRHFICDDKYFTSAFKKICCLMENPVLICFSDDPQWVKDNMSFPVKTFYEKTGNSLEEKIILMSSCKNFVLSNSSFSWWIEYLSINENKIVIAPNKWYATEQKADIFQKYWHLIEV